MRAVRSVVGGLLVTVLANVAMATEGGGGAYPNGAEGFMAGALPPPGHYLVNYLTTYSADTFTGPNGDEMIPGFDLTANADVLRMIYVSPYQVFGGSWAAHVFLPVVDLDAEIDGVASQSKTEVGDIIIDPFIVGWHSGGLHCTAGLDVYVPSGNYVATDFVNVSRGYWTLEPVLGVTYLCGGGIDTSVKLMYDYNFENGDTDYQSGQEFHVDYNVAKKVGSWWLGVGGYYYKQTTDDDAADPAVAEMGKGMALAVGPAVKFDHGRLSLIGKYQVEVDTENRPEGDKAWLNLVLAF